MEKLSTIKVHSRTILRATFFGAFFMEIAIVLADIFFYRMKWIPFSSLRRSFNITREDTVVNWFSSTQTFLVAIVLIVLFFIIHSYSNTIKNHLRSFGWAALSLFFAFMAIDDGARIHERLGDAFKDLATSSSVLTYFSDVFPSYYWQLILGPFFLVATVFIVWFLLGELGWARQFQSVLMALFIFSVAVALDFVEGLDIGVLSSYTVVHSMKLAEEFLEMFANTIFLVTFLEVMFDRLGERRIVFLRNTFK